MSTTRKTQRLVKPVVTEGSTQVKPSIDFWELESKEVEHMQAHVNLARFADLCKDLKKNMRLIDENKKRGNTAKADWLKRDT
ncbi:THO complex subunit 5-like [Tropilaelaps mercedesae]|uniref:THO complex subunit 5-like n=1 Tax=Tropilaelaps mercedesae TaxID=418985 RepID=A0A1V9X458_9ACAR|nr:THO complex subunit 5-like [Tropilaelaps mercedesae]